MGRFRLSYDDYDCGLLCSKLKGNGQLTEGNVLILHN